MAEEEIKMCVQTISSCTHGSNERFVFGNLPTTAKGVQTRKVLHTTAAHVHLNSIVLIVLETCIPGQAVPSERQLAREFSWKSLSPSPKKIFFDKELSIAMHSV